MTAGDGGKNLRTGTGQLMGVRRNNYLLSSVHLSSHLARVWACVCVYTKLVVLPQAVDWCPVQGVSTLFDLFCRPRSLAMTIGGLGGRRLPLRVGYLKDCLLCVLLQFTLMPRPFRSCGVWCQMLMLRYRLVSFPTPFISLSGCMT